MKLYSAILLFSAAETANTFSVRGPNLNTLNCIGVRSDVKSCRNVDTSLRLFDRIMGNDKKTVEKNKNDSNRFNNNNSRSNNDTRPNSISNDRRNNGSNQFSAKDGKPSKPEQPDIFAPIKDFFGMSKNKNDNSNQRDNMNRGAKSSPKTRAVDFNRQYNEKNNRGTVANASSNANNRRNTSTAVNNRRPGSGPAASMKKNTNSLNTSNRSAPIPKKDPITAGPYLSKPGTISNRNDPVKINQPDAYADSTWSKNTYENPPGTKEKSKKESMFKNPFDNMFKGDSAKATNKRSSPNRRGNKNNKNDDAPKRLMKKDPLPTSVSYEEGTYSKTTSPDPVIPKKRSAFKNGSSNNNSFDDDFASRKKNDSKSNNFFFPRSPRSPRQVQDASYSRSTAPPARKTKFNDPFQGITLQADERIKNVKVVETLEKNANYINDIFNQAPTVTVQGESIRTCSFDSTIDRVQVCLKTNGRPLTAQVELWDGPDNAPQTMKIFLENGFERPFCSIIETSRSNLNSVAVKNIGRSELPFSACVDLNKGSEGTSTDNPALSLTRKTAPRSVQGGAIYTTAFEPEVASIQLVLRSDGRPVNARVELLQGPNNNKQVMDIYSEDGSAHPFFFILETPGSGSVLRIVNTSTLEYPLNVHVEPFLMESMRENRRSSMLDGLSWSSNLL